MPPPTSDYSSVASEWANFFEGPSLRWVVVDGWGREGETDQATRLQMEEDIGWIERWLATESVDQLWRFEMMGRK